jgi:hypothetical protein
LLDLFIINDLQVPENNTKFRLMSQIEHTTSLSYSFEESRYYGTVLGSGMSLVFFSSVFSLSPSPLHFLFTHNVFFIFVFRTGYIGDANQTRKQAWFTLELGKWC